VTLLPDGDGTTPITYEESDELVADWIETRADLNAAESLAITRAVERLPRSLTVDAMLDARWLQRLHLAMFRDVWRWAGVYRRSQTNIGVDWHLIVPSLHDAVADARVWFGTMPVDEAAIRFHHRLVAIHPFPNGNGRWSRIIASEAVARSGALRFSWGANLPRETQRLTYLRALRIADETTDVTDLVAFARS
jgi:Fic-DOC domain mobile mystery protein B